MKRRVTRRALVRRLALRLHRDIRAGAWSVRDDVWNDLRSLQRAYAVALFLDHRPIAVAAEKASLKPMTTNDVESAVRSFAQGAE